MKRQVVFLVCPGQKVSPAHHLNKNRLKTRGRALMGLEVEIIASAITRLAPIFSPETYKSSRIV